MNESVRVRLTVVLLAIVTLAGIVFAFLNFEQRSRFNSPDDGVSWVDTQDGVQAWHILPDSPAANAGIKPGDILKGIDGTPVYGATQVTRRLWRLGVWTGIEYNVERGGRAFSAKLVTVPSGTPGPFESSVRVVGLLYLFIGLFIFARRWNAPRAMHFYVFCLVSFIFYSFHYTGKLNGFDQVIYWGNVVGLLLQPALLVHFALVFPERRGRLFPKLLATYALPAGLLLLHVSVAAQMLDFLPSVANEHFLDQIEYVYLGLYFLAAATIFLRSYLRAPSGVLRQQLKWITGGTLAGILPFFLLYTVPLFIDRLHPWMGASVLSLVLIPLCFGYAIIRYRLMDVDVIF